MADCRLRLFCFYNWKYVIRCVVAPDQEAAHEIAVRAGHVKRGNFRRITELTCDDLDLTPERRAALERLLSGTAIGLTEYDPETNEWSPPRG